MYTALDWKSPCLRGAVSSSWVCTVQVYNGIRTRARIVGAFKAEFLNPDHGSNDFSAWKEAGYLFKDWIYTFDPTWKKVILLPPCTNPIDYAHRFTRGFTLFYFYKRMFCWHFIQIQMFMQKRNSLNGKKWIEKRIRYVWEMRYKSLLTIILCHFKFYRCYFVS